MHLTIDRILLITQAASKQLHRESARYRSKVLFYHAFVTRDVIKVPNICSSPSKLAPLIRRHFALAMLLLKMAGLPLSRAETSRF
eukprot:2111867-Pleurochrysis_carterae.AAC.2